MVATGSNGSIRPEGDDSGGAVCSWWRLWWWWRWEGGLGLGVGGWWVRREDGWASVCGLGGRVSVGEVGGTGGVEGRVGGWVQPVAGWVRVHLYVTSRPYTPKKKPRTLLPRALTATTNTPTRAGSTTASGAFQGLAGRAPVPHLRRQVWGLEFRFWGLGFGVWGLECWM